MNIEQEMLFRYVRGIGLSSAPLLDSLWTPREHQDATIAAMLGIDEARLASLRSMLRDQVEETARQLLAEPGFAADASRMPFASDDRIIVVGDSISADALGWANILRAVLNKTAPQAEVINRAVPGRTTAETLYSLPFAAPLEPTRALVMLGTNDTRRLGKHVGARMASPAETERNLRLIRELLIHQLGVRTATFITPPPADPAPVADRRGAGEWNEPNDLAEVAEIIRRVDPAAVDLHGAVRPSEGFFDVDGLHPTPAGQVEMTRIIVRLLAEPA